MAEQRWMTRVYDWGMRDLSTVRYFDGSGFFNFGLWTTGAATQKEASEALVDDLLGRLPHRTGRILDVACGLGASTARLTRHYPADMVTAINISETQLAEARRAAPGSSLARMDATRLGFPDGTFDAVLCVEAAFHFDTRDDFLREAFRVLKPGGSLVMSDMLFRRLARPLVAAFHIPPPNLLPDLATYRERLGRAGFVAVKVEDATDACVGGFRRHLAGWAAAERRAGRFRLVHGLLEGAVGRTIAGWFRGITQAYLLVSARKPA